MYVFAWTDSINEAIERLWDSDPEAAVLVEEFFDLCAGPDGNEPNLLLVDVLTRHDYRRIDPPCFETVPVGQALRKGYNVVRVKLWTDTGRLLPFRVLYAVDHTPHDARIVFLALMPREDDYEMDGEFWRRVFADYDEFGIAHCPAG